MIIKREKFFDGPTDGSVDELAVITAFLDGRNRSKQFTRLAALFGDDFPAFMLVFTNEQIDIPSRAYLERASFYSRIWIFVRDAGSTDEAIDAAATKYNLPRGRIADICEKVETMMSRRGNGN